MSQVSKIKLDKDIEEELFNQFWHFLGKINNSEKSSIFYSDFYTQTEKIIFAKRFLAMILLVRGRMFDEIKDSIHLSKSTITSISFMLKSAKPETQKILKLISVEKNIENISDKIDNLLDKLPLKPYTNWTNELKERRKRENKREVSKILR